MCQRWGPFSFALTHYSDVITGAMAYRLFTQPFVQAQIKQNIKTPPRGHCKRNSPGTGEFLSQRASDAENVSTWWRHHATKYLSYISATLFQILPKYVYEILFGLVTDFWRRNAGQKPLSRQHTICLISGEIGSDLLLNLHWIVSLMEFGGKLNGVPWKDRSELTNIFADPRVC